MRFSWKSTNIGRTGAGLSLSYALVLVGCSAKNGDALAPRGKEVKSDQTQSTTVILSERFGPADIRFFSSGELGPRDPNGLLMRCKLVEAEGTFVLKLTTSRGNYVREPLMPRQFSARLFTKDGQPLALRESPGQHDMVEFGNLGMSANFAYKFVRPAQMCTADLGWITVGYKGRVHQVRISEATQTDPVGPVDPLERDLPSRLAPGPIGKRP